MGEDAVSGGSQLADPELISFHVMGGYNYSRNCWNLSSPNGLDAEILSATTLSLLTEIPAQRRAADLTGQGEPLMTSRYQHSMELSVRAEQSIRLYPKISMSINHDDLTLVPFTILNRQDKVKILSIRNRLEVRRAMNNTKRISISSHLQFIKSQESNPFNINYAVFYERTIIGSASLHKIDWIKKEAWLDIYRHPNEEWRGFGKKIMLAIKYIAFDIACLQKLKLCVKTSNSRAILLYNGFNFIEDKLDNDIMEMTLVNEGNQKSDT
ncbi:GNAT family N-acetyltransferase [Aeromonas rivipollensis]|uniref:GNAT family N-acetyltransferase n=1 Tax=Aeromonas rivipollensis TaxID=948519 RepID=UPI00372D14F4